jgi:hypothetical protein
MRCESELPQRFERRMGRERCLAGVFPHEAQFDR